MLPAHLTTCQPRASTRHITLIWGSGSNLGMYFCIFRFLDCRQMYKRGCSHTVALEDPHCVLWALTCNSVHVRLSEMSSSTELGGKKFSGCKIRSQLQARVLIWQEGRMKASFIAYSCRGLGMCITRWLLNHKHGTKVSFSFLCPNHLLVLVPSKHPWIVSSQQAKP